MTAPVTQSAVQAADTPKNGLQRLGQALMDISAWPGKMSSWLIFPIIFCVMAAVVGGIFRLSQLASWGTPVLLFGDQLNIIGLVELQWHLLAVMVMLGGSYALNEDRHVRVDMIYGKVSPRWRATIDALGDLIFLLPFCALIAWLSLRFVDMSFKSGERSDYGGLTDRYLVKSIIPIGLGLLFLTGVGRVLRSIGLLISGDPSKRQRSSNNG